MLQQNIQKIDITNSASQSGVMKKSIRWFKWTNVLIGLILLPVAAVVYYAVTIYPTLSNPLQLKTVSYQVPLRIVTQDNKLISEIGIKRRLPLAYHQIPELMKQAIISSEDKNFFEHSGVDYKSLGRAVYELVTTGQKKSGGSTITMQVARNFFLSKEKTYLRKLNEIILSYKIEAELSKQEILALYLNKIFLGFRSYGVAAAAKTYYGKPINELSLNEFAMIAGLPKAPSSYNPIINPERAKLRRNYVLHRMFQQKFITQEQMLTAQAIKIHAQRRGPVIDVKAGYVAEIARKFALDMFGKNALQDGLTIVTTLDSALQTRATFAIANGLQAYERRHGYRGPIEQLEAATLTDTKALKKYLKVHSNFGGLKVGVVTGFHGQDTQVFMETEQYIVIPFETMTWAATYISINRQNKAPRKPQEVLAVGDVIYLQWLDSQWQLAQNPKVESALVSLDSHDGSIKALVGGFDYFRSKFNRATQSKRQIGSNIKPFLYSAALETGMTAATMINDAPVVFYDKGLEDVWRPENYSGRFYGPTRLRKALVFSRNLVSIRLLQQLGIKSTAIYLQRFAFSENEINRHRDLSLALGSVQFSPLEVARAYATFSNTGFLIEPFIIKEVHNLSGEILYKAQPKVTCTISQCIQGDLNSATRIIDPLNAYIMTTIMQDVIRIGSGKKALSMRRADIAGKTGTTNDQKDAWFSGFNPNVVTTVWVGFDQPSTMGRGEVGGRAALPIWIDFMNLALKDEPNIPFNIPEGLINIKIDSETGEAVPATTQGAIFEIFREAFAPELPEVSQKQIKTVIEELFE